MCVDFTSPLSARISSWPLDAGLPGLEVPLLQLQLLGSIGDDQEANRLAVATLRAEASGLYGVVEHLLRYGVGLVVAARVLRAHGIGEFHVVSPV